MAPVKPSGGGKRGMLGGGFGKGAAAGAVGATLLPGVLGGLFGGGSSGGGAAGGVSEILQLMPLVILGGGALYAYNSLKK